MSAPLSAADLYAALRRQFEPSDLEWRAIFAGKNNKDKPFVLVAPYVNRPALVNRLNQVCGVGGWQSDARVSNGHTYVGVGIRVSQSFDAHGLPTDFEWVWRWDGTGFLESDEKFKASDAGKGDFSNAFKRACELFGCGLYLREVPHLFGIINSNGRYKATLKGGGEVKWDPPGLEGSPAYPGEIPGFEDGLGVEEGSPPRTEAEKPGPPPEPPAKQKPLDGEQQKAEIQRCKDRVRNFMADNRLRLYHLEAMILTTKGLRERYQTADALGRLGTLEDWQLLAGLAEGNGLRWDQAERSLAEEYPTGPQRLELLDKLLDSVKTESDERLIISAAKSIGWNDAVEYWIAELGKR